MQLWSKHNCWISNGKTIVFAYFLLVLRLLSLQTYCIFFCLKFALSPAKLLLLFCYAFSLNFKFFCKKNALSLADRMQNVCKTHILATFGLAGKFTKSIHIFNYPKKPLWYCPPNSTDWPDSFYFVKYGLCGHENNAKTVLRGPENVAIALWIFGFSFPDLVQ